MLENKKAFSETISFILITLLIVVFSIGAYYFSKSYLENNIIEIDKNNMHTYMKMFNQKFTEVSKFNNASVSMNLNFKKGQLNFKDNQVYYQSLSQFTQSTTYCFDEICYYGEGGYERVYYNLTAPYNFDSNVSLEPGEYIIIFRNIKNESKINVRIK